MMITPKCINQRSGMKQIKVSVQLFNFNSIIQQLRGICLVHLFTRILCNILRQPSSLLVYIDMTSTKLLKIAIIFHCFIVILIQFHVKILVTIVDQHFSKKCCYGIYQNLYSQRKRPYTHHVIRQCIHHNWNNLYEPCRIVYKNQSVK